VGNSFSFYEISPYEQSWRNEITHKSRNYCVAVRPAKLLGAYGTVCMCVTDVVASELES
jgi:hypothetical protein